MDQTKSLQNNQEVVENQLSAAEKIQQKLEWLASVWQLDSETCFDLRTICQDTIKAKALGVEITLPNYVNSIELQNIVEVIRKVPDIDGLTEIEELLLQTAINIAPELWPNGEKVVNASAEQMVDVIERKEQMHDWSVQVNTNYKLVENQN